MVNLICGKVGSGKTKKLINLANDSVKDSRGDIVYIEHNNKHMLNLKHQIRFINAMEFDIKNLEGFHGFLCGIISEDYDIEKVYIDEVYKIIDNDNDKLEELVNKMERLSEKYGIEFTLTMSRDPKELSHKFNKYMV